MFSNSWISLIAYSVSSVSLCILISLFKQPVWNENTKGRFNLPQRTLNLSDNRDAGQSGYLHGQSSPRQYLASALYQPSCLWGSCKTLSLCLNSCKLKPHSYIMSKINTVSSFVIISPIMMKASKRMKYWNKQAVGFSSHVQVAKYFNTWQNFTLLGCFFSLSINNKVLFWETTCHTIIYHSDASLNWFIWL